MRGMKALYVKTPAGSCVQTLEHVSEATARESFTILFPDLEPEVAELDTVWRPSR